MSHAADGPYWKRAHRDWRVRAAALVMVLGMVVYLLTENLAWRPAFHSPPPASPGAK